MFTHHALRVAAFFVVAGLVSRFAFQRFETRWQILIFWGFAALYQFVIRPAFGHRISIASYALDAVAVAVAIIAMKLAIEGHL